MHTEYPKWVNGKLCKDSLEEAKVRGAEAPLVPDVVLRASPSAIGDSGKVEFVDRIELGPNSPVALIEPRRSPGRPPTKAK